MLRILPSYIFVEVLKMFQLRSFIPRNLVSLYILTFLMVFKHRIRERKRHEDKEVPKRNPRSDIYKVSSEFNSNDRIFSTTVHSDEHLFDELSFNILFFRCAGRNFFKFCFRFIRPSLTSGITTTSTRLNISVSQ